MSRNLVARVGRRLTFANVVSLLALFVALGGSSYAAIKLPRNSVGPKQVKAGAITSPKVKNASLLAEDFGPGQLPKGDRGPEGPPNPNALNSDKLDDLDSSAFLRSDGKAADADKLDGVDSAGFARSTTARFRAYSIIKGYGGPGGFWGMFPSGPSPQAALYYSCPNPTSGAGVLRYRNWDSSTVNIFSDNGSDNPTYQQLAPDADFDQPTSNTGEHITFQVHSPAAGVATWEVFSVHRANDCHVQFSVTSAVSG